MGIVDMQRAVAALRVDTERIRVFQRNVEASFQAVVEQHREPLMRANANFAKTLRDALKPPTR